MTSKAPKRACQVVLQEHSRLPNSNIITCLVLVPRAPAGIGVNNQNKPLKSLVVLILIGVGVRVSSAFLNLT